MREVVAPFLSRVEWVLASWLYQFPLQQLEFEWPVHSGEGGVS